MKHTTALFLLAITTSCSTTPSYEDKIAGAREVYQFYNDNELLNKIETAGENLNLFYTRRQQSERTVLRQESFKNIKTSKIIFDHYCKNGRQRKPITSKVKAVIVDPPSNLAVEEIASYLINQRKSIDERMKAFYILVSSIMVDTKNGRALSLQMRSGSFSMINGSIEEHIKSGVSKCDHPRHCMPSFYMKQDGTFIAAMVNPISFSKKKYQDYFKKTGSPYGVYKVSLEPNRIEFTDNKRVKRKGQVIYNGWVFSPSILPELFTLLIPPEVQKSYFTKRKINYHTSEFPSKNNDQYFFIKRGGDFDLTDAIKNKDHVWVEYINNATRVTKAQSSDPRVINYEVELNLNLFCKYGRYIGDLF